MKLRRLIVLAVVVFAQLPNPAIARQAFSLDQVMSAPFPSDLTASVTGTQVAWVQNDRGTRNIWIAEAPDYQGRMLTAYTGDTGQTLGELAFTPDGARLIFVVGDGPNRSGEVPNPTNLTEAPSRSIHSVRIGDGETTRLADGSSPVVSPDGQRIAFVNSGQVWSVPTDGSSDATRLFTIRGRASTLAWDPAGTRIAFASLRGEHSFVGVWGERDDRIVYLAPSFDADVEPAWSPDGSHVAFLRIPYQGDPEPFTPARTGIPWSIVVADPSTGEGSTIWTADDGAGSIFREVNAYRQLIWTADGYLVFPWEKDRWTHLYSLLPSGGQPTLLTPGTFEVQHVSMSADRRSVLFSSNQDDVDRRHVWRVAAHGGSPERITPGNGIEWSPVGLAGGGTVVLASSATVPAHVARAVDGRLLPLAPDSMPRDFPTRYLVEPQAVEFRASDGMLIHGQLFLPPDSKPGDRHPALIFTHGGSRRQMLLGFHHRGYYHNAYALNQYLASRGYVVLSVNYRSGIGYGMDFREAIDYGAQGASEYRDVVGGGLYLASRADVDAARIGLWGGSYGGYLTALGLARGSDLFAAGVDFHGVHDWTALRSFYDSETSGEARRVAFEASPLADVDTWRSPVLLIHGDDDRNVPFSESITVLERLRRRGVHAEQLVFPDEIHGFLLHSSWIRAYEATADFFDRFLTSGAE